MSDERLTWHRVRDLLAVRLELRRQIGLRQRENRDGQEACIGRTARSDCDRRDRYALRHLHRREQRVEAAERGVCIGTPMTGSVVWAATTPARWAAPPAAAMMTFSPRAIAPVAYSVVIAGVRCADMTRHSCGISNFLRISSAWRIVSQSD